MRIAIFAFLSQLLLQLPPSISQAADSDRIWDSIAESWVHWRIAEIGFTVGLESSKQIPTEMLVSINVSIN
jgi:hypothetical protein